MIIDAIGQAIEDEPTLGGVIGASNIFQRKPLEEPQSDYLYYVRAPRTRSMVDEQSRFTFFLFSKSLDSLETLTESFVDFFEERHVVDTMIFYKISMIGQSDSLDKLKSGFYYNTVTLLFQESR